MQFRIAPANFAEGDCRSIIQRAYIIMRWVKVRAARQQQMERNGYKWFRCASSPKPIKTCQEQQASKHVKLSGIKPSITSSCSTILYIFPHFYSCCMFVWVCSGIRCSKVDKTHTTTPWTMWTCWYFLAMLRCSLEDWSLVTHTHTNQSFKRVSVDLIHPRSHSKRSK